MRVLFLVLATAAVLLVPEVAFAADGDDIVPEVALKADGDDIVPDVALKAEGADMGRWGIAIGAGLAIGLATALAGGNRFAP